LVTAVLSARCFSGADHITKRERLRTGSRSGSLRLCAFAGNVFVVVIGNCGSLEEISRKGAETQRLA
jgi:hypothetical protein